MTAKIRAHSGPFIALSLALALAASACANETQGTAGEASTSLNASAELTAEASARTGTAPTVASRLGGNVVWVGDYQVDLAVYAGGRVKALVLDAQGKPLSDQDEVELSVTLHGAAAAKHKLALSFDATCKCFTAVARGAKLNAQPIAISLGVAGRAHAGVLAQYALIAEPPAAQLEANVAAPAADLDARGVASAQTTSKAKATLTAPSARVKASAQTPKPKVELAVKPSATASAKLGTSTATSKSGASAGAKAKVGFSLGR